MMQKNNTFARIFNILVYVFLYLPIVVLIAVSVFALIYVGGFYTPGDTFHDFIGAFGNTDATVGLPLGGIAVLVLTMLYLVCRRLVSFKEAMACVPKGFIAMVPAITILTLAVALKTMTGNLGADVFFATIMEGAASALYSLLPAVIFVAAIVLAFSSGTSWGTFCILIPIVVDAFADKPELMIIAISACMAGAVCGDHCSPISDTTIMSSAGAQCDHVNHVNTQLPYAITVAAVSFVSYIIAGFVQNVYISLAVAAVLTVATLFVIKKTTANK